MSRIVAFAWAAACMALMAEIAGLLAAEAPGRKHVIIEKDAITFRWGATDRDMALLEDHPNVKTISLGGGEPWSGGDDPQPFAITDAGFAHIANCKKLEQLYASSIHPLQVTDDGLKAAFGRTDSAAACFTFTINDLPMPECHTFRA